MLAEGTRHVLGQGHRAPSGGALRRSEREHPVHFEQLLGHGHPAAVQVDPALAELRHVLVNNLRNTRISLRLDDEIQVMHKTGTLADVVNDVGVIRGPQVRVAVAYFCDGQADTARTSVEIGDSALLGVVLVALAAVGARQQVFPAVLALIGGALAQASVVTLVLGSMTARETTAQVDSAVLRGLQDVLEPVRDPIFAGGLSAYRWDCHLAPSLPDDPHPDYAYQSIRMSSVIQSCCGQACELRVRDRRCFL